MAKTSTVAELLVCYEKLVATIPGLERRGATMPYTSLNGNMFSFLTPAGVLALRLPADERAKFLKKYKSKLCEQHGKVLEEYVEVPAPLLKKMAELKKHFAISHAYAGTLKAKATTRKKATKKE
jgi:hypothetical protein